MKEATHYFQQSQFGYRFCKNKRVAFFSSFFNWVCSTFIFTPPHPLLPTMLLIMTNCFFTFAQTRTLQIPQTETFKPLNVNSYYTNSNLTHQYQQPIPTSNNSQGGTAQDIINQQNRRTMQTMGNTSPVVPPSDPYLAHQFILNQYNQSVNPTKNYKQQKELLDIINEAHVAEKSRRFDISYFKSTEFTAKSKSYNDALKNLKDMLSGNRKLSVADAYFEIENAYGNSYLSKQEYNKIIKQSVLFIGEWLVQNNYRLNDNDALHLGVQKFMGDTLTITWNIPDSKSPPQKITHLPFSYDYNDFTAEKDFRNYFSSKCLATGSGQCNSLPAVYSAIAEGLGAKSYLTFAPQHSFIKYFDDKGNMHNYEPTSNWKISDEWYEDNMFISPTAKANGIYLDTLNREQIIASCILDLAFGYMKKFGAADGEFVKECVNTAMRHFPKGNNIEAYFVYSSLLARQLERNLNENNITDLKDINKSPEAQKLYQALVKNEEAIKNLGYQDMPESLYQDLMQQHEFKGRHQAAKNISGKEKRNLFIKSNF